MHSIIGMKGISFKKWKKGLIMGWKVNSKKANV